MKRSTHLRQDIRCYNYYTPRMHIYSVCANKLVSPPCCLCLSASCFVLMALLSVTLGVQTGRSHAVNNPVLYLDCGDHLTWPIKRCVSEPKSVGSLITAVCTTLIYFNSSYTAEKNNLFNKMQLIGINRYVFLTCRSISTGLMTSDRKQEIFQQKWHAQVRNLSSFAVTLGQLHISNLLR